MNHVIATKHTYVCLKNKGRNRPLLFFWGAFYPRPPKSKEVNAWNRKSNARFEAHGRRAQEMTRLVIGWMFVHSDLYQRTWVEILAVGQKKCGGQNHLFLTVWGTYPLRPLRLLRPCSLSMLHFVRQALFKWFLDSQNLFYTVVIIHGSKLKHLLNTVLKHAFCLCLLTDTSVSHRLANANSFSASRRRCWSRRNIEVSPVTAVIKKALRSQTQLYQALQERQN